MTLCSLDDVRPHKDFITTRSGAKFYLDKLNVEDIPIEDIAWALSMNCRFNGHIERHYSVAEHCVLVSHLVPGSYALEGLMHDASEAFVPDMPRPFKRFITGFDVYENQLQQALADFYGFEFPLPEEVLWVDRNIVRTEAEQLYGNPPDWVEYYDDVASPLVIEGWSQQKAFENFMYRYEKLCHV